MKLFYATNNTLKINNMKKRLFNLPIEIITPNDIGIKVDVEENGKNVIENAIIKAKAYYHIVKMPTIAGDSSLFIEGIPDSKQPGLYVRRKNGKLLTNEEMIEHYIKLIDSYGGRCKSHYVTGLALIIDDNIFTKEVVEDELILSSTISNNDNNSGDPLAVMTIDPVTLKYYNDLTDDDYKNKGLIFDKECIKFIEDNLLNK